MHVHKLYAIIVGLLVGTAACSDARPNDSVLEGLTRLQAFETRRESSAHEDLQKNGDARSIEIGETLVLGELEGPGVITHIWCTVASEDPFYARSLVLRIYWDGMERPSVEAPLGDFFGVGHSAHSSFTSLPVAVSSEGRARNCFWRMPFRESARVTVTNESDTYRTGSFYYYLDWQKHDSMPDDIAYFHARYRQEHPARPGDYTILETRGRGHYVGTVHSAQQVEIGWFGEGDDRFYVDGEDYPSLSGTGTEDYFCDAWGFRQFSTPFYGVSLWEGYFPGDRVTAYRWHLSDPVTFKKLLKVQIEHRGSIFTETVEHLGQFIERPDWISSVAFWYQSPAVGADEPIAPVAERVAPYRVLRAADLEVRAEPDMMLQKDGGAVNYMPATGDAKLEFDFDATDAGMYQLNAVLYHSVVGGKYQPFLDGKPLGQTLDLCIQGADWLWVRFDLARLESGKHTLRFEGRGVSPNKRSLIPTVNQVGMYYLVLLRLEDMEGYHAEMNRILQERQQK
ncbi:MAG: DUF2961 domain-containing protein [Armatimonadota bacterium]|nr:MAG: DUF2961 domain-containing protein [Armatimonadota bacterium]